MEGCATKGQEETFGGGDGDVHYLDYRDGFMSVNR